MGYRFEDFGLRVLGIGCSGVGLGFSSGFRIVGVGFWAKGLGYESHQRPAATITVKA